MIPRKNAYVHDECRDSILDVYHVTMSQKVIKYKKQTGIQI